MRSHDIHTAAERGCLCRLDQQDASDAEAGDRADDRAFFYLGDLARDTGDDSRHDDAAGTYLCHEDVDHFFDQPRFGDHTALEREYDVDLRGRSAKHPVGFFTYGEDLVIVLVIGDDRRLVDRVFLIVDPQTRVGCTKI